MATKDVLGFLTKKPERDTAADAAFEERFLRNIGPAFLPLVEDIDQGNHSEYLLKGGFLWVDDFWGSNAWDVFEMTMARVLDPQVYPFREIGPEHPVYRTMFPLDDVPQIPSIQFWGSTGGATSERGSDSVQAHLRGIADAHGRLMVLATHNTDISDAWEREGEDPEYFYRFSPNGYATAINIVLYAMSH